MVQLRLYLKELKDFLNTVTIKDEMLADSMLTTWVKDEWQETVANNPQANPYYRALLGEYIVFSHSDQLRRVIQDLYDAGRLFVEDKGYTVDDVLNTLFPTTTKIKIYSPSTGLYDHTYDMPNKLLYRYSNEVPIISSYDDTYQIPFAREFLFETGTGKELGLRVHSSTSVVYRIPNQRYNTLISRYPGSSAIIHSIVYPIPIGISDTSSLMNVDLASRKMKAIQEADDISALTYDPKLLETQEKQSIIDCLITTLDMIRRRYNVRELGYENLYAPAHYYIIWQVLYLALYMQRVWNIHTGNAHLYHIWNYLKSNGFEDYRDVLTLRQQKFLYKNLPYLIRNKGTEHVFEILEYVFFHTQNISLHGKNTIQSTEDGDAKTVDTTKKYPAIRSIQIGKPLLDGVHDKFGRGTRFEDILHYIGEHAGEAVYNDKEEYHYGTTETKEEFYDKERAAKLEYQNDSLFERSTTRHTKLLSYSSISHRNTKTLELKNNNTVDYMQALYTKFVGETILYRIAKNNLDFLVEIQLPESSKRIELPVQDWIGLLFYALTRANNNHCDRPPNKVYISWPYDIEMSDDDWQLPDTFHWYNKEYKTASHLAYLVSSYQFNDKTFLLSDNRQDVSNTDRFWTDEDGNILRYNYNTNRWNIVDKNENVIYRSAKVYSDSVNLADLSWFDAGGQQVDRIIPLAKTYMADFHMPRYNHKVRSVEEFADVLHEQAIGFIIMNLETMHDESAVHRSAYHMIMQHRCVGEVIDGEVDEDTTDRLSNCKSIPIELNLLNGKTYKEYLTQKIPAIDYLNLALERYDLEADPSTIYSRMADEIIMALLPPEDPFLPYNVKTTQYRYQKIIDLFKSMTAYNLAYLNMDYVDVDSTKMSMNVSAYGTYRIRHSIVDTSDSDGFDFHMSTAVKTALKPRYPDQDSVIFFTKTYAEDEEDDLAIKQAIVNNIDAIMTIYNTKKLSKTKRHNKLVTLLGEDTASVVESMSYVQLQNIQNAVHVVGTSHIAELVHGHIDSSELQVSVEEPDTSDLPYQLLTIPDAEVNN